MKKSCCLISVVVLLLLSSAIGVGVYFLFFADSPMHKEYVKTLKTAKSELTSIYHEGVKMRKTSDESIAPLLKALKAGTANLADVNKTMDLVAKHTQPMLMSFNKVNQTLEAFLETDFKNTDQIKLDIYKAEVDAISATITAIEFSISSLADLTAEIVSLSGLNFDQTMVGNMVDSLVKAIQTATAKATFDPAQSAIDAALAL